MLLVPLGIIKRLATEIDTIVRFVGARKIVAHDVNETLSLLIQNNVKFLNIEPLKDGKPTGWVGVGCLSFDKVMPCVRMNADNILAKFYDTEDIQIEK